VLLVTASSVALGLVSNVVWADDVEQQVQKQCEEHIAHVARLWGLPPSKIRRLPPSAIRMGQGTTRDGKRVTFQVPPNEKPPFWYARARHAAPFVLRVQYGWATSGSRMAFGQGGEQLVLSVFGRTTTLRDRADWHY
jgi:hypothetical protein